MALDTLPCSLFFLVIIVSLTLTTAETTPPAPDALQPTLVTASPFSLTSSSSSSPPPYSDCDPVFPDGEPTGSPAFNSTFVNWIVAKHNALRRNVSNPTAVEMPMLSWDVNLAQLAQAYMDKCPQFGHSHPSTRVNVGGFTYVSESLAAGMKWQLGNQFGMLHAIFMWGDERRFWTYGKRPCPADPGPCGTCVLEDNPYKSCGHYTNLIWANTTRVGCGYKHCPQNEHIWYYACYYGAGGNFKWQEVYEAGPSTNLKCGETASPATSIPTSPAPPPSLTPRPVIATGSPQTPNPAKESSAPISASTASPTASPQAPPPPRPAPNKSSGGPSTLLIVSIVGVVVVLVFVVSIFAVTTWRRMQRSAVSSASRSTNTNKTFANGYGNKATLLDEVDREMDGTSEQ